jgi:hypothetical protein
VCARARERARESERERAREERRVRVYVRESVLFIGTQFSNLYTAVETLLVRCTP